MTRAFEGPLADGPSGPEASRSTPGSTPGKTPEKGARPDSGPVPSLPEGETPEVDELAGNPDTPVPDLAVLVDAMQWAFQGEEIEVATLEAFARHAHATLLHNRVVNLTAIVEPKEMAAKHYLDSWRVTRLLPLYGKRVLDLGSGAGFPGIPVALGEKETKIVLLDSTQKRVNFLQSVVADMAIKNATAVWDRAEEHLARNNYDVVLMRAVSSVRENVRLLRKVRHALKDLVMFKGQSWSREVRAGEREAERLGFKLDTVYEHKLPGEMGDRAILVYRAPGGQGR